MGRPVPDAGKMLRYQDVPEDVNRLARRVNGIAIDVHRTLGPGLLESAYQRVLAYELARAGYGVELERPVAITYGDLHIAVAFRADLVVNDVYVLELKCVEEISHAHIRELKTYLRLGGWPLGFVLNFNAERLYLGMRRVVP